MINLTINTDQNVYNLKCKEGDSLKDIIKNECINFIFPCGGVGRCGNCKVKVLKGVQQPTYLDKSNLSKYEIDNNIRLACSIYLKNDTEIYLKQINLFELD